MSSKCSLLHFEHLNVAENGHESVEGYVSKVKLASTRPIYPVFSPAVDDEQD